MSSPLGRRRRLLDPLGEQASYDRSKRRGRIIGRIVVGFFALVVLGVATAAVGVENVLHKVHHGASLDTLIDSNKRPAKPSPASGGNGGGTPENILILGVDSRLGENSQYQVSGGLPAQTESLSDTAILAHLSADGKHATLVSIPRDSVVEIPQCRKIDKNGQPLSDASGNPEYTQKTKALFNEAIQLGGPACSAATLESLAGVRIDHYLEIDFTGVVKMSEALGGVPLTMCEPIRDSHTGLNLPAGPVNLKGQQALAFVRARYGLTGGDDLHRIQRQQQFMASMARKALDTANFFDPTRMYSFYSAVAGSLTTDMSSSSLVNLALHYRHIDTSNIVFVTVPTYPAPKGDKFYQHLYWSEDEANTLFSAIQDDRPLATSSGNVAQITVAPSNVSVSVLNGVGTNGLAGQVAGDLRAKGFRVVNVATAQNVPVDKTTLTYSSSRTTSMQALASALAVKPQEVVSENAGSTITLTIGKDWAGLAAATASASPTPVASGSPSPATSGSALPGVKTTNASSQACVQG